MKTSGNHLRPTTLCIAIAAVILLPMASYAKIYKYKDADGNWRFTDSPVNSEQNAEIINTMQETGPKARNLEQEFAKRYEPKNPVEKATLRTLKIDTPMGSGSGFFVNADGYILTNKHVIKGDENQKKLADEKLKQIDAQIRDVEEEFDAERRNLQQTKRRLDEYKRKIDRERNVARKMAAEGQYNYQLQQYKARKRYYNHKRREFNTDRNRYSSDKYEYRSKIRQAHTRSFTVTLKDRSTMQAHLVALSADHDLALLKLDRCIASPYLSPRRKGPLSQGQSVYAVGSPLGIRDTVSSGVVSGFDADYVRTNAHIYPGNSGGPLIDEDGNVVGINTLKMLTRNFEGLGYAIDIRTAMREFRSYLEK